MFEKKFHKELEKINKSIEAQSNWENYDKINKDLKKQNYISSFLNSNDLEKNFNDTIELLRITDENSNLEMYMELENELNFLEKILVFYISKP